MNSLPNDLGMNDIGQWLNSGWFLFKRRADSAPEPGKLGEDNNEYCIVDMDGDNHNLIASLTFPFWPACGAINLNGFAVYVERRQVRQYRRTYNDQCVTLTIPRKWDVMKKHGTEVAGIGANNEEVIKALFSPVYYTYSQAAAMMESGAATSVALNYHLIVAGPLVYYRNTLVAKLDGNKLVPMGCDVARIRRIVKFFEGRVTL